MGQQLSSQPLSNLTLRVLSAAFLIPLSLYVIYRGPPYSFILGGIVGVGLFIEWISLCLKNRPPFWSLSFFSGTVYLGVAIYWFFHYLSQPEGWKFIYWLLFLVWSTDSTAFAGGKLLQGPKLAPSISPNKTWSGFFAGMVGGTAVGYGTSLWLVPNVFNFWEIAFLVLAAQAGDLLESQAKRWAGVKDSSPLIPGHGGLLDRLDGLLAVLFVLALFFS